MVYDIGLLPSSLSTQGQEHNEDSITLLKGLTRDSERTTSQSEWKNWSASVVRVEETPVSPSPDFSREFFLNANLLLEMLKRETKR